MLNILHEDADLLVVNKPAGLVCHPTKGDELSSLISRARLHLNTGAPASCRQDSMFRAPTGRQDAGTPRKGQGEMAFSTLNSKFSTHLINRLDRETSGVVLLAKNAAAAGELGKIWETRDVEKEYLALVHGHVRDDHGLIDAPLGKAEASRVAIKDCVRPAGAPAQTEFFVERRFYVGVQALGCPGTLKCELQLSAPPSSLPNLPFSLLRLVPRTGRKHQLRIHLAHLGHPIVGDKLYGGDEDIYLALVENRLTAAQRQKLIFPHQALHARSIKFFWRGRPVEFSCAPEPWFTRFLDTDFTD